MLRIRDYIGFEIVVMSVYWINAISYGAIGVLFAAFSSAANNHVIDDSVLMGLFLIIYLFPPFPLALIAHKNKRNIEKYIHFIYITFAPLPFFILFDSTEDYFIPPFYIVLFILSIPFFFLFKNLYLYYKYRRLNTLQPEKRNLKSFITEAIKDFRELIKELPSYEQEYQNPSSLDIKSKNIKEYVIAGAIAGIIAGAVAGINIITILAATSRGVSEGAIAGAIGGVMAGTLAGVSAGCKYASVSDIVHTDADSDKCIIASTIAGAIVGADIRAVINYIFY